MIGRLLCRVGLHWFEPIRGINAVACVRTGCPTVRDLG